jgi:hypothetical protein
MSFNQYARPWARASRTTLAFAAAGLCGFLPAGASGAGLDGAVLLRTCQGAAQVKALSVICQSYLNGFIDTAAYYESGGRTGPAFCLGDADKERIPTVLVVWLNAHPEYLKQPAPAVLHQVLSDNFPCRKKR